MTDDVWGRDLLLEVEGIGPKRADALLSHFGSSYDIAQAALRGWGEIMEVDGFGLDTARSLYDRMREAGVADELTSSRAIRKKPDEPDYHPCGGCGREIPAASEECADCLNGDREPTLADFAGGDDD